MYGSSSSVSRSLGRQYGAGGPGPAATRLGTPAAQRPLPGSSFTLLLNGQADIRPSGPVAGRTGQRLPGGVGTDLTDPSTWRRRYAFPGGNYPQITAKQHFT
jgi:hypothetical protein